MQISYTYQVIGSLIGDSQSKAPKESLKIIKKNVADLKILLKNIAFNDSNEYVLTLNSQEDFFDIVNIIESDSKQTYEILTNHYTSTGQYLKIAYQKRNLSMNIEPMSKKETFTELQLH